ncbi:hypothetical protein [Planctomyces sp. SH-PL62]|uniref:hypothetical protein n=1 Tax=Planctomyces sp. SH-PL62 TaxID=1636152 RepID=UPI00078DECD9|nr:hypothetical protein [Planctomyces sp. SH-PL62]AMV37128.1 hypothetical protein VT85_06830 [Planctomyces sp. SH-PL62]
MRLTLRTLLAWLDDTLPPVQVREIGKQVGSSPLAQELVQRIHRVTRQRRLTVPGKKGADATDPNLVASYLDNDLNAEQVAEYEKKCLTSDVNLAEAASVHQILSLLGQRVQVPPEAKARMYLLVKGREARAGTVDEEAPAVDPRTQPITPWVVQARPSRHWLERFGPLAACLALIALLSWSAYESLKPDGSAAPAIARDVPGRADAAIGPMTPPAPAVEAPAVAVVEPDVAKGPTPEADDHAEGLPEVAEANAEPKSEPKAEAVPKPAPAAVQVPAGAAAVVDHIDGMLLRYDGDLREWVRSREGEAVDAGDRVMAAPPFAGRLATSQGAVNLLEDSEVRFLPAATDGGPSVELVRGRILAEPTSAAGPLHVSFQGRIVDLDRPADLALGFDSDGHWAYGRAATGQPPLTIHVGPGGEVAIKTVKATEKVKGPASVRVDAAGAIERLTDARAPEWITEKPASAELTALREHCLKEFSEDRPVLADIVSATENDDADVKRMAVAALRGLGDLSLLTPILDRPGDPAARRAAVAAIREELSSGEAASRRAWDQLQLDFGDYDRDRLGKLLLGFAPADAARPETLASLVKDLSPDEESLAVRELAIDNLIRLTGRDAPAYDADRPEQGYAAWRKLLDDGALKPAAAPAAK